MPRILVIANQTIGGPELREEVRKRVESGQGSFYLLVPNTAAGPPPRDRSWRDLMARLQKSRAPHKPLA